MKIQRSKLSHGGLKASEKQKQGATAVGSGDWLGIVFIIVLSIVFEVQLFLYQHSYNFDFWCDVSTPVLYLTLILIVVAFRAKPNHKYVP